MASERNNKAATIAVILTCAGMLAAGVFMVANTSAEVRHNGRQIEKLETTTEGTQSALHELDKKMTRVLTILEEREERKGP